ncbi:MAG: tyrosine--tRNA ligase [Nannocystaceae bacterium]
MVASPISAPRSAALKELVERGYFEQASDVEALDRNLEQGMVTAYIGYDPTARSLHVGNLLTIMALRVLQRHGHRPICLIGAGTALVGDPSGRSETRRLMTTEQIAENATSFRSQLERFLHFDRGVENDAFMLNNADWLGQLGYLEFLRDIGRHFTVNRMIAAKTYRDRLEAELPLSFLEFNYQLLQAYDFWHLYHKHGCTLQMGGSDQWGNMIAGVELIRRSSAHSRATGTGTGTDAVQSLTCPLLTTPDGRKMGKTERGAVWLDPRKMAPFEYYQYWINSDDSMTGRLLRLFTELPLDEITALTDVTGAALREAKNRLAFETTELLHGRDAATQAQTASKQAFGGGGDWSAVSCVEIDTATIKLIELVAHPSIAAFKSKRDARQRIESGAVRLNGAACADPNHLIRVGDCGEQGLRLQAGKRNRFRVRLTG